jgi:hypothetical protein
MTRYGLGWLNGQYRGLRIVSHAGGNAGFTAEIAFLPEADLGLRIRAPFAYRRISRGGRVWSSSSI